jgi:hypothetical protein
MILALEEIGENVIGHCDVHARGLSYLINLHSNLYCQLGNTSF